MAHDAHNPFLSSFNIYYGKINSIKFFPPILRNTDDGIDELVHLDVIRDSLRARASDILIHRRIAAAKTEDERALAIRAWENRIQRRILENKICGTVTPPGQWDDDLDTYNKKEYEFNLGEGYRGLLRRNAYLSWNGYVMLPETHPFINKSCFFFGYEAPNGFPEPPMEITFAEGRIYGFDHANTWDIKPYQAYSRLAYTEHNHYDASSNGQGYKDFHSVKLEVIKLADYFRMIVKNNDMGAGVKKARLHLVLY